MSFYVAESGDRYGFGVKKHQAEKNESQTKLVQNWLCIVSYPWWEKVPLPKVYK